jgi:hypothetical protein
VVSEQEVRLDLASVKRLDQRGGEGLGGVEVDVLAAVYGVAEVDQVLDVELVDVGEEDVLKELRLVR